MRLKLVVGLLLIISAGPCLAAEAGRVSLPAASANTVLELAAAEGALLHRRLNLSGIEEFRRTSNSWQPLIAPKNKLLVMNLWDQHCEPCKRELPTLAVLYEEWRRNSRVAFLFVAELPMTREQAVEFWSNPFLAAENFERCSEPGLQMVRGPTGSRCLLPRIDSEPSRTRDGSLRQTLGTPTQPLTLLVDSAGVVRQAFVGSLTQRQLEFSAALQRLLAISERTR